eukprot:TRINITY_DN33248_c0_g1_i1.p1 TRINITY_DN33248_c0_g1~~TRINITY_DN33248_c0_g1_i1.p1  ORF type:complete len:120 (-),score=31.71 TRINITY_DN33248_c0_g1_i1:19-378(-)
MAGHFVLSSFFFFLLMIRRPPRSTHCISSAASDVYKRQRRVHGHQQSSLSHKIKQNRKIQMKVALIGYGKMGKEIEKIAISRGHEIVSIIDLNNQEDFNSEAFINNCLLYTSPSPRDQA